MTERPILFSALLAGTKTQTRRAMKPQPAPGFLARGVHSIVAQWPHQDGVRWFMNDGLSELVKCPYGKPGERLWVREAHSLVRAENPEQCPVWYWADGNPIDGDWTKPRPSIHMPRWASRILLEITGVRVERLNDISDADAQAEGTPCYVCGGPLDGRSEADCHCFHRTAKLSDFCGLWESINGAGSWTANPWVWVVEFKRLSHPAAAGADT